MKRSVTSAAPRPMRPSPDVSPNMMPSSKPPASSSLALRVRTQSARWRDDQRHASPSSHRYGSTTDTWFRDPKHRRGACSRWQQTLNESERAVSAKDTVLAAQIHNEQ